MNTTANKQLFQKLSKEARYVNTTNDWNTNHDADANYRPPPVPHTCNSSMADTARTKPSMDQSTWSLRSTLKKHKKKNPQNQTYLLVTAAYHAPVRKGQAMETVRGRHGGLQRENG